MIEHLKHTRSHCCVCPLYAFNLKGYHFLYQHHLFVASEGGTEGGLRVSYLSVSLLFPTGSIKGSCLVSDFM